MKPLITIMEAEDIINRQMKGFAPCDGATGVAIIDATSPNWRVTVGGADGMPSHNAASCVLYANTLATKIRETYTLAETVDLQQPIPLNQRGCELFGKDTLQSVGDAQEFSNKALDAEVQQLTWQSVAAAIQAVKDTPTQALIEHLDRSLEHALKSSDYIQS